MRRPFTTSFAAFGRPLRSVVVAMVFAAANGHAAEPAPADDGANAYKQLPLRRDTDLSGMGWRLLIGLGVLAVAGAFVVARARMHGPPKALRRRLIPGWKGKPSTSIEIVEQRSMNAACQLYVVRWNGEEILLGCNPGGVSVVSRRPFDSTAAANTP